MLTIEVAAGGRIIASCDGQRKEHRFRKSNSRTHSKDYEILMNLAAHALWRNPPAGTPENEAIRKRFYRFRETLDELVGIPGKAFNVEGDDWKPVFKVSFDEDLKSFRNRIASEKGSDIRGKRHRVSRADSSG